MTGFPILDLVIGLIFIFFVLSIITSSVVEMIMTYRNIRSRYLRAWLLTIFDKPIKQPDNKVVPLGRAIMDHCLTTALAKSGKATAFMDASNFVSALIEKVSYDPNDPSGKVPVSLVDLLDRIENAKANDGTSLLSTELRRTILIYGHEALGATQIASTDKADANNKGTAAVNAPSTASTLPAMDLFRNKLGSWFDSSMERVTGTMKKKYTRPTTLIAATFIVILLNVDTIKITSYLYDHKEEAKQFADRAALTAQNIQKNNIDTATANSIKASIDTLRSSVPKGMPIGWDEVEKKDYINTVRHRAVGWLATIIAVMLGAPFWFDLLNKIANIRGTGSKPPPTSDSANPNDKKSS